MPIIISIEIEGFLDQFKQRRGGGWGGVRVQHISMYAFFCPMIYIYIYGQGHTTSELMYNDISVICKNMIIL